MALGRAPPIPARSFIAGWPVYARLPFVPSAAYLLLAKELRGYVLENSRGRSFLIAGHRGSGKTALVRQVVEAAQIESLRASETWAGADMLPQRPLLVQLYGPSLVNAALPEPPTAGGSVPAPAPVAEATPEAVIAGGAPEPAKPAPVPKRTSSDTMVKGALEQIAIALYRAVADEFAQAVARHAGAAAPDAAPDLQELAAQLRLDLDMGADASRLRDIWRRLGCLTSGVLWPGNAPLLGGQGAGEIAALVTAGQAFQVCTGKLDVKQTDTDSAKREASIEAKTESGLKEFGDKLMSLAAGLGMGAGAVAAKTNSLVAAVLGIGVALLSSITLSWSGKRSLARERATEYSFMPDRSVETLERDLPMVIRRLRDVGLAPVFVVDELDKLAPGVIDPAMAGLIDRLKLLLTDHAFFCFLADRDYYDRLDRAVAEDPFCREHTYYNDRLFIEYRAEQLAAYAAGTMTASDDTDRLAQLILARRTLHQAEMNFIRLLRGLSGLWGEGGAVRDPSDRICASPANKVQAVVQLAIEHVLGGPTLGPRLDQDVGFAQLANDALYMISRAWLDDDEEISLYRADVAWHLLKCLRGRTPEETDPKKIEAALLQNVSKAKLDALAYAVAELAGLLTSFSHLRAALASSGRLAGDAARLLETFDTLPAPGLLAPLRGYVFRFTLDKYGISLTGQDSLRPGHEMDQSLRIRIMNLSASIGSFTAALATAGTDPAELIQAGLLPRSLSWGEVAAALSRMETALVSLLVYDGLAADLQTVSGFDALLNGPGDSAELRQENLGLALSLCVAITALPRAMPGPPTAIGMGAALAACERHLGRNWPATAFGDESSTTLQRWTAGPMRDLSVPTELITGAVYVTQTNGVTSALQSLRSYCGQRAPFDMRTLMDRAWTRWEPRIREYLRTGLTPPAEGSALEDILLAAADLLPSRLLRADLAGMLPWEWSLLVLEAAADVTAEPKPAKRVPDWALPAGLYALGFAGSLRKDLVIKLAESPDASWGWQAILSRAAEPNSARQGILAIVESHDLANAPPPTEIPVLWVTNSDARRYNRALTWLADAGVFKVEEVIYGRAKLSGKAGETAEI